MNLKIKKRGGYSPPKFVLFLFRVEPTLGTMLRVDRLVCTGHRVCRIL